jgi:hypothetical protein
MASDANQDTVLLVDKTCRQTSKKISSYRRFRRHGNVSSSDLALRCLRFGTKRHGRTRNVARKPDAAQLARNRLLRAFDGHNSGECIIDSAISTGCTVR